MGVFRDNVSKFRLDSFPKVVIMVFVDFLDFDKVVEHLVTVYHLQTV